MSERTDKDKRDEKAQAFDGLADATAVGFAVASRTMEMWFGMMSGFARASREIMAPQVNSQLGELEKAPPENDADDSASVVELSTRRKRAKAPTEPRIVDVAATRAVLEKRVPKAIERPAAVDDLKRIAGIGPKLEQVLNGFGIWTYAQIVALQAEEIAWLDDALGLNGRIDADNWQEQADALGHAATQNKDVAAG